MKINPNVVHRIIAGDHVLIPIGRSSVQSDGMFMLSDVGGRIWELLAEGADRTTVIRQLCLEYDAPEQTITLDANEFIDSMIQSGLLEE